MPEDIIPWYLLVLAAPFMAVSTTLDWASNLKSKLTDRKKKNG